MTAARPSPLLQLNAAAAAGLCIWYTLPALSGLRPVFFVLAALWLLSAGDLLRWLLSPPRPLRLLAFLPWLLVTLLYLLQFPGNEDFSGRSNAVFISLFAVVLADYYVSAGRFSLLKKLCSLSLVSYLSGALWAAFFATADVSEVKMAMQVGENSLFSANFGTYYAAVFLLGGGVWLLFSGRGWARPLGAAAVGICTLLLLRAQFTISILLALLLLLLLALYGLLRRPEIFWLLSAALVLCTLLLLPELGEALIRASSGVSSSLVSERLLDLGMYLRGSGESVHAATRLGLYQGDIQTFLRHPFTGSLPAELAGFASRPAVGGHNSLLRLLAEYGIFLSAGFLAFAFGPAASAGRLPQLRTHRRLWQPAVTVYLILCCVNPTFNVPTLSFTMAMILPFIGLLSMDGEQIQALEEHHARKQGAADYRGNRLLR